jgi:error-prone DNA polymerase
MQVVTDYATTGLSLKQHPVAFARRKLTRLGVISAADVQDAGRFPENQRVSVCGLVLVRQRPGTASGVVFITLEDETGIVNLIVWGTVYDRYRRAARHATLLQATGTVQRQGQVIHVVVKRMIDRTSLIGTVSQSSRDFH